MVADSLITMEAGEMDGDKRRRKILQFLVEAKEPVTGHMLAGEFDVSRQN